MTAVAAADEKSKYSINIKVVLYLKNTTLFMINTSFNIIMYQ
jgi:hypothetical protein